MLRCLKHEEKKPFLRVGNNVEPIYFPPYMETETQNSNGIGREGREYTKLILYLVLFQTYNFAFLSVNRNKVVH